MGDEVSVDREDLTQLINTLDQYLDLAWENSDEGHNWPDDVINDFEFDDKFLAEMRKKYDVD